MLLILCWDISGEADNQTLVCTIVHNGSLCLCVPVVPALLKKLLSDKVRTVVCISILRSKEMHRVSMLEVKLHIPVCLSSFILEEEL